MKTAVVFPGMGYTKDRPLLYFGGKLAVRHGYELIHLDFSGLDWSKEKLKDMDFMMQTLNECLRRTQAAIADKDPQTEFIFISKSIGTVVAAAYAARNGLNVRHICFSPLEYVGRYIADESGIMFYADADPFAGYEAIEKICDEKKLERFLIHGGNHSLETGDITNDINNLGEIMKAVSVFMDGI